MLRNQAVSPAEGKPCAREGVGLQCGMCKKSVEIAPRGERAEVEGGEQLMPKFDDKGLLAAVAQDVETGEILMLAWMNEESLRLTLEKGEAVYWSRSRQEIWHKGATSGQVQIVHEIRVDCDQDALVLRVDQRGGGACHTGARSCFFRKVSSAEGQVALEPVS